MRAITSTLHTTNRDKTNASTPDTVYGVMMYDTVYLYFKKIKCFTTIYLSKR